MDVTLALQRAVRGFALGSGALAAHLGISVHSLNHKVSPTYAEAHCSPEEALSIMQATGDHGALHALAQHLGYVLLPMPSDFSGVAHDTARALVSSVQEFGEFAAEAAGDLADGGISDNELERLEAEGADALASIQALLKLAQQLNERDKPGWLLRKP